MSFIVQMGHVFCKDARRLMMLETMSKYCRRADPAIDAVISGPVAALASGGSSSPSGCRTVIAYFERAKQYLGYTIVYYHFNQEKRWCWNRAGAFTSDHTDGAYFSRVDRLWYPQGNPQRLAYRYNWVSGAPHSGHYSRYQQRIDNCIVKYGCIGNENPYVKIWSHSDGTYTFDAGR